MASYGEVTLQVKPSAQVGRPFGSRAEGVAYPHGGRSELTLPLALSRNRLKRLKRPASRLLMTMMTMSMTFHRNVDARLRYSSSTEKAAEKGSTSNTWRSRGVPGIKRFDQRSRRGANRRKIRASGVTHSDITMGNLLRKNDLYTDQAPPCSAHRKRGTRSVTALRTCSTANTR